MNVAAQQNVHIRMDKLIQGGSKNGTFFKVCNSCSLVMTTQTNVKLFIRGENHVLNVASFKYSLHVVRCNCARN